MSLYHYHDSRDLEVDAVIAAPGGTWIPVEVKLSSAQIEEASDNLVAVEERMVAAGNNPPVSKVAIMDLVHKPMLPTAASKLFRWMCSRRNAVGEVKLTPQFFRSGF